MPISSQWPSVVSLPLERSISRPATAGAPLIGGQPSSGSTLPRPSASRLGRSSPPTAWATLPSVSDPSSPNSAASGSSPAPTASSTMTHARGMGLFYEGREHGPGPPRRRRLHPVRDRAGGGYHVGGSQGVAAQQGRGHQPARLVLSSVAGAQPATAGRSSPSARYRRPCASATA